MNRVGSFLVVVGLMLVNITQARVIYGDDNRIEVSEASEFYQHLARSTAVQVSNDNIKISKGGKIELGQISFSVWFLKNMSPSFTPFDPIDYQKIRPYPLCATERFLDQPVPGTCSGFLIAPDLIVTAGHCMEDLNSCSDHNWIFDYNVDPVTKKAGTGLKSEDMYRCKRIVSFSVDNELKLDHAIVQLDRPVTDREPLEIRDQSTVSDNTPLVMIGSPLGLPTKVSSGANVLDNKHVHYFVTNTDSFVGNSGSAVFNATTGIVEGILVNGEEDFVPNTSRKCVESKKCLKDECKGEDVSRLTSIPEIRIKQAFNQAAKSGDIEAINKILTLNTWIDFNGKDGRTPLIKAAMANQIEVMKILINHGADLRHRDIYGKSAVDYLNMGCAESNSQGKCL